MTDNFMHHTRRFIRRAEVSPLCLCRMGLKPMRTFCTLILLLYFAVFSAMPLSNIHVEDHMNRVSYTHGGSDAPSEDFLIFLHELLSLHFRDQGDHALFPHKSLLRNRAAGSTPSSDYDISGTPVAGNQAAGCDLLKPPPPAVPYPLMQGDDSPLSFAGYHFFSSSLSPPSA